MVKSKDSCFVEARKLRRCKLVRDEEIELDNIRALCVDIANSRGGDLVNCVEFAEPPRKG